MNDIAMMMFLLFFGFVFKSSCIATKCAITRHNTHTHTCTRNFIFLLSCNSETEFSFQKLTKNNFVVLFHTLRIQNCAVNTSNRLHKLFRRQFSRICVKSKSHANIITSYGKWQICCKIDS